MEQADTNFISGLADEFGLGPAWELSAVTAFTGASAEIRAYIRGRPHNNKQVDLLNELMQASAAGLGVGNAAGAEGGRSGDAQSGGAGSAVGPLGVEVAAGAGGPDTSTEYIRRVLLKPLGAANVGGGGGDGGLLMMSAPAAAAVARLSDQPLGAKLPVLGRMAQSALASNSELGDYVVTAEADARLAADAYTLCMITTSALMGMSCNQFGGSETFTTVQMARLVDDPLSLAATSLGLHVRTDRNTTDRSGATGRQLRPDFLCWVDNVLLFKGEEKANASDLETAITELEARMATSWNPALLPGVSMPCMFAYAAAGSAVQFFAITSSGGGGAVQATAISDLLDTGTPLGRIKVVHHTLVIVRALAAYAPYAPKITMALGGRVGLGGAVEVFSEFVRKSVDLAQQHGTVMGYPGLADMYRTLSGVCCPNLVRLHSGSSSGAGGGGGSSSIRLQADGRTLVLHLEPVGLPLHGAPASEADLKQALRHVLTAVAALHAAGFVHRDIRWHNVIRLPAAASASTAGSQQPPPSAASSSSGNSSSPAGADTYVLIDLEHAAPADCDLDCRQPPHRLHTWPAADGLLDPATGRYTRQSDLCLVAAALMANLPFALSDAGRDLRQQLATRQVPSAEAALHHAWLCAT
ncbi:hypothetical protein HYH02_007916 [Chlamydomonas schloesseri]|uniref:Protein kinase domain-containing protein n=1 Tax=Chlamydomonas schloesseri TaxID=2026947 RepID=A0A836B4H9_9CHLO|nr:hypothetical protein HYH02_007916 [Chlamydomonas schloesseri]|eukprot:KAG2447173.1 hypothetical protein HYH02_007916 [Chlamydomonas schloesseri]